MPFHQFLELGKVKLMADVVYSNYFVKLEAWLLMFSLKPALYHSVPGTMRRLPRTFLVYVICDIPTSQSHPSIANIFV
jgi:hypothetical protein